MAITIKQLAKLSGMSTRTLRFYDEIDLLKPASVGENQYRYYETEQLLKLQQIIFYRELDFPLKKIKAMLSDPSIDNLKTMQTQKKMLADKRDSIDGMLKIIDKTIQHLKGEVVMQVEEFFKPANLKSRDIQKEYEAYLIGNGVLTKQQMAQSWQKIENWVDKDWDRFKGHSDTFYKNMTQAINNGLDFNEPSVQSLIKAHHKLIKPLWHFDKTSYFALACAYENDENFKRFCDLYHSDLHVFLVYAMKEFSETLS